GHVQGRLVPLGPDTAFGGVPLQQPQSQPPQQGEVLAAVAVSDAAGVLAERHVHLPMQLGLDTPMVPQPLALPFGRAPPAADETPLLITRLAVDGPLAGALADDLQARPRTAVPDALRLHDHLVEALLLPAVAALFRLMPVVLDALAVPGISRLEAS